MYAIPGHVNWFAYTTHTSDLLIIIFITKNVWQSLAYSPLDIVVSPLVNTYETHP